MQEIKVTISIGMNSKLLRMKSTTKTGKQSKFTY